MRALTTALLLALALPASAAEVGGLLQVELGSTRNHDDAWGLFSENDVMPSRGIRGGLRLGDYVAVVGGWHRIRKGASVSVPSVTGENDINRDRVVMAYFGDTFSLGVQGGYEIGDIFRPYAGVDGLLLRGTMKLDENSNTKQNPGQVLARGLNPGVLALGGLDLHSRTREDWGFTLGGYFELGYSWYLSGDYGDLGPMRPGGFTSRVGVGVTF